MKEASRLHLLEQIESKYDKLDYKTVKNKYFDMKDYVRNNSASVDGGTNSRVCLRLTLRSCSN